MGVPANVQGFLNEYGGVIVSSCMGTRLLPSVVIAQAALETGWGATIKKAANNMFGIKGKNWTGKVISLNTSEYINGSKTAISGTGKTYNSYNDAIADGANPYTIFRVYGSIKESISDHNRLITESKRYKPVIEESTPEGQCDALQKCEYSTSAAYAESLKSIIRKYNLTQYDNKKKARTIATAACLATAAVTAVILTYITVRKWN